MGNLTAYRCLECDHVTVSKYDGRRCAKCKGRIAPIGDATYVDKRKSMTVEVSVKDTDIFKCAIALLNEISNRGDVPDDIKEKINIFASGNCKA